MNYYRIILPSDPKIVGRKNGESQCEIIREKFERPDDYQEIFDFFVNDYWTKSDFKPNKEFCFDYVKLHKDSKLTDILSISPNFIGCEFVINSKVKGLFSNLNTETSHFFPLKLFDRKGKEIRDTFYLIYVIMLGYEFIDFEKSLFFTGSEILGKEYHSISNEQEFTSFFDREKKLIQTEKIVLNKNFKHLDIFSTRLGGPFISEKLIDRWNDFQVSGFKLLKRQMIEKQ